MSELKVEQAFIDYWQQQAFGLPVAYENAGYDPVPGTPYVELQLFPNETIGVDLSTTDEATGFFQFDLKYVLGTGAIPAKQMRQIVFDAFPVGGAINYDNIRIDITAKIPFTAGEDRGWYSVVGRINYKVKFNR